VIAVEDRPQNVAGVILAAPADPQRFHLLGLGRVDDRRLTVKTLADVLPTRALGVPGVLVASENDPWMSLSDARQWAQVWDIGVVNAGTVGHLNTESGFGPWPFFGEKAGAAATLACETLAACNFGIHLERAVNLHPILVAQALVKRHFTAPYTHRQTSWLEPVAAS
jgi:hypothetical protein